VTSFLDIDTLHGSSRFEIDKNEASLVAGGKGSVLWWVLD